MLTVSIASFFKLRRRFPFGSPCQTGKQRKIQQSRQYKSKHSFAEKQRNDKVTGQGYPHDEREFAQKKNETVKFHSAKVESSMRKATPRMLFG